MNQQHLPPSLINVNSHKFVVIIPAAGAGERFTICNGLSSLPSSQNVSRESTPVRSFNLQNSNINNISCSINNSNRKNSFGANRNSIQNEPKQYQTVCNRPLIFHTVSAFLK